MKPFVDHGSDCAPALLVIQRKSRQIPDLKVVIPCAGRRAAAIITALMTTTDALAARPLPVQPEPLSDALGRALRDLRISVTDRCNFRCVYCMPKEVFGQDYAFLERKE